jgi:hypothetical protein
MIIIFNYWGKFSKIHLILDKNVGNNQGRLLKKTCKER